jgi:hypothetical protein
MAAQVISLVAETKRLGADELGRVAKALQTQLTRDFEPIWKIAARVETRATLADVPASAWPVRIRDKLDEVGAWSFHAEDNGRPQAQVTYGDGWTLGVSHDTMEMLVDPKAGTRFARAPSIRGGESHDVDYLVQICDPCSSADNGYRIDGVLVSDFSTPLYWSGKAQKGALYSKNRSLSKPLEVARGGYLSWRDPRTQHFWQKSWFGERPTFNDLGEYRAQAATDDGNAEVQPAPSIRGWIKGLQAIRLAQQPGVQSIRMQVEALIRDFGREG